MRCNRTVEDFCSQYQQCIYLNGLDYRSSSWGLAYRSCANSARVSLEQTPSCYLFQQGIFSDFSFEPQLRLSNGNRFAPYLGFANEVFEGVESVAVDSNISQPCELGLNDRGRAEECRTSKP